MNKGQLCEAVPLGARFRARHFCRIAALVWTAGEALDGRLAIKKILQGCLPRSKDLTRCFHAGDLLPGSRDFADFSFIEPFTKKGVKHERTYRT